jgi:hypothetical protein
MAEEAKRQHLTELSTTNISKSSVGLRREESVVRALLIVDALTQTGLTEPTPC